MRIAWLLALLLTLAAGAAVLLRTPATPADRMTALTLPGDRALRLGVLGTSLSHQEPWTARLGETLAACLNRPVEVSVIARPGAAVNWGLSQVDNVTATKPDVLLIEFAINDADMRDGHSLRRARHLHEQLLETLRSTLPDTDLVLMTMSPAQGPRGVVRLRLGAHYRQYTALAEAFDIGLIDLYPRWRALPRAARGLEDDGLHPDPEVAASVIVPAISAHLTEAAGLASCP